jgi:hypothetical protein
MVESIPLSSGAYLSKFLLRPPSSVSLSQISENWIAVLFYFFIIIIYILFMAYRSHPFFIVVLLILIFIFYRQMFVS